MKTNSRNSHHKSGKKAGLAAREIRTCTVCRAKFSALADGESCPMCMLRQALARGVESSESCSEDTAKPLPELRGVFLATVGAEETEIEASFCEAIRIAREQKSVSLLKRAEGAYAEYRSQKRNASGGRGCRLPLC